MAKKQTLYDLKNKAVDLNKAIKEMEKKDALEIGYKVLSHLENDFKNFDLNLFKVECRKLLGVKEEI